MTLAEPVAFLDVDTQVDFMKPEGKLYAQGAEAIEPNLRRLLDFARERGLPLVSSVDAHREGDEEFAEYPPHCLLGTPGQQRVLASGEEAFVPSEAVAGELPDPRRQHVVLEKQRFSLFSNPNAEAVLARTGAKTFVVFGVVTEVCVRQAVLGLLERGYRVCVVRDAVWPIARDAGEAALEEMRAAGAEVLSTDEVLSTLAVTM
ncbi:MAG: cysteine hydrolase [Planctomycetota bacterium]|nr:MAG: cysteine hydrolase [Planctomycetota bacterium]